MAYSPSGLTLAAGGDDEGIKLVDMSSAKVFRQLKAQVGLYNSWRRKGWHRGKSRLRLVAVPSMFSRRPTCVPACAPAWVQAYTRSIAYDPEGAYVASTNGDGCLNVWEIEGGKQVLGRKKACPKVRPALARGLCAEQRLALGLGAAVRQGSEAGRAAGAGPGWHAPCLHHIPAARPVGRPQADLASTARCQPAWHPDGGALLAAPGTDSDIVCYERMSW